MSLFDFVPNKVSSVPANEVIALAKEVLAQNVDELTSLESSAIFSDPHSYCLHPAMTMHFLQKGDEYRAEEILIVFADGRIEHLTATIPSGMRIREMSSASVFQSEHGGYWAILMLFHKGVTYFAQVEISDDFCKSFCPTLLPPLTLD